MFALSSLAGAGWQFFDDNGDPLSGGKLYSYDAGTTTPATTYTSSTGSVPNANPIVLDAAGRVSDAVWLDASKVYKFALKSSTNVDIWTKDNIPGIDTASANIAGLVSVADFGAVGDGITNDTAALQAAISSGSSLLFPEGVYLANNLVGSTNFQRLYSAGHAVLVKNANGPILTHQGSYVELNGLQFNGGTSSTPLYTGDNVVLSGTAPRLINCGSQWAYGRAVKATGSAVQIIGTCGVYQTADTSATGYDIELGISGVATLYHQLRGVYSSQSTGGILLTDTGSHSISGGQFGKLTMAAGTRPAGSNGGMTANARILGDVTVELSNATFSGNQFGTQTITFALGTSGHSLDTSNLLNTATIVNNGNANSAIIKSIGTGSPTGIVLQYGSDAFNSTVRYTNDEIYLEDASLNLANNKPLRIADALGTFRNAVTLNNGDDWTIGADTGANFMNIVVGSGGIYHFVNGANETQTVTGVFRPVPDGTVNLGGAANRWNTVYATTGAINTSDARTKQDVEALSDAERRVAAKLKSCVKKFRFKDAVQEKGSAARIHVGVIAQEVIEVFKSEGLDALHYGLICYDAWGDQAAVVNKDTGEIISPAIKAGDRYGIRYEELLAFILGAL
jgi:hypothetical protein